MRDEHGALLANDHAALLAELDRAKAARKRKLIDQPHPVMAGAWSTSGIWWEPRESRARMMRMRCGRERVALRAV